LDKTKETEKLSAFLGENEGLLSWKLDGLTIALRYENGALVQAVTRGNGITGEDVTHNARVFANVPLTVPYTGSLVVRGEAVIPYDEFERINTAIDEPNERYKNPRNLCSGTVRQLNSEIAAKRRVRFYAFGMPYGKDALKSEQFDFLAAQGFEVVEYVKVNAGNIAGAVESFKARVRYYNIASDGLVLTYDSIPYSASLGATSKFPRDALAFKWADETVETTLLSIEWSTSRTGLINPVAVFAPVEIDGTTVNKASLHNVSVVRGLELGIGDIITVYKANMIIPQVAENLSCSGGCEPPARCPSCGSPTAVIKQIEGEALYCTNKQCRARLVGSLAHFCSRDAFNIEGLSEQTLEKFVERGFVNDYTDLFDLARYKDEITAMEGFGEKSYENVVASVERAKENARLENFICALGIRHGGLSNAKLLCAQFDNDIERILRADYDELMEVIGFGDVLVNNLLDYFANETNVERMRKALGQIKTPPATPPVEGGALSGLVFVVTGEVLRFANRKALQERIEGLGGRCASFVSAKTNFLINNDADSSSSKNKRAQELGVPVITEDEFIERFGVIDAPI
jgi:DNA ligase (NAD+)